MGLPNFRILLAALCGAGAPPSERHGRHKAQGVGLLEQHLQTGFVDQDPCERLELCSPAMRAFRKNNADRKIHGIHCKGGDVCSCGCQQS